MAETVRVKAPIINKGLYRVGISIISTSESEEETYGPVTRLPGSREFSAEPQGDPVKVYADSGLYYSEEVNDGYTITLTLVRILDTVKTSILGEVLDNTDKMLMEHAESNKPKFALIVQSLDDSDSTFQIFYSCKVEKRPTLSGKSKEGSLDPQFEQITITSSARDKDGLVRAASTNETPKAVFDTLFTKVWEPTPVTGT